MRCSLLTLSGYLDGELDAARRGEVDGHLVGCDRCRNALSYLQEEAERIGSLARVRVPDEAIHGFMAQLELIGPEDTLSPRRPRTPVAVTSGTPPWLAGRATGTSLPWAPKRDDEGGDPDDNQPSLPFTTELPVHELFRGVSSRARPPQDEEELNLNGRSTLAAGVPRIPIAATADALSPAVAHPEPIAPSPPAQPPALEPAPSSVFLQASAMDADTEGGPTVDEDEDLRDWAAVLDPPEPPVDDAVDLSATPLSGWSPPSSVPPPAAAVPEAPPSAAWAGLLGHASYDATAPPLGPPAGGAPPPGEGSRTFDAPQADPSDDPLEWDLSQADPPEEAAPHTGPPGWDLPQADPPEEAAPYAGPPGWDPPQASPPDEAAPRAGSPDDEAPGPSPPFVWTLSPRLPDGQPRDAEGGGGDRADPDEDLWSWAPRGDSADATASEPDPSDDGAPRHLPPAPPPFESTWAGQRSGRAAGWAALAAASDIAGVADAGADPPGDPLVARAPHRARLSPPSPVSWLRDKVALRLALMRTPSDAADEGFVSGPATRRQPPERRDGWSHESAELPRSVESAGPIAATAHSWNLPTADGERSVPAESRPYVPTTAEEIIGPEDGFVASALVVDPAGSRAHLGRHMRSLARQGRAGAFTGTLPEVGKRLGAARVQARRAFARAGRWWVLAGSMAVLVLLLAILVPLSSKPASTPVTRTPPTTLPSLLTTPRPGSPTPSATVAPTAAPSSAPVGYLPPAPLTIGNGGAGWQLSGIDYGQHATYLSVVLNLNPGVQGGTGEPTVVISAPTAQTMVVTLTGVILSSSSGTITGSGVVTGVGVTASGNQTALRLALAQSVTVQSAGYVLPTTAGGTLIFYLNLG